MKNKLDVSWKDFLAGVVGYLVSLLLVGLIMVGVGIMVGKMGDEALWSRYEILIACGTFLGFLIGGMVLGKIRPITAVRNATILFLVMLLIGVWRMGNEITPASDVALAALQVSGIILGAWLVQRRHIQKKKIV
ncbi:MAG: hypothetical protein AAB448_04405 [Patescibacteria group bacterium]